MNEGKGDSAMSSRQQHRRAKRCQRCTEARPITKWCDMTNACPANKPLPYPGLEPGTPACGWTTIYGVYADRARSLASR